MMGDKPVAGCDVSKDWLEMCWGAGAVEPIANNPGAIAAWLERVDPGLVAFEPTGGYERALVRALRERGVPFRRVHPNAVVAYRQSRGINAKTDRIDARLLREFVVEGLNRPEWRTSIPGDDRLRAVAARRRQLIQVLHAERCRLAHAATPGVRASIERVIAVSCESLAAIEEELAAAIAEGSESAALDGLLQTIYGIGSAVAATLVADVPELGLVTGKQIGALIGLAPRTNQSGTLRSRETTGHGRAGVRRALFNAARAAIRHPSPFKDFYDRLVTQNHRPGKVALTAVMRKILVIANAVARDRQPWRGARHPVPPHQAVGTPCRPLGSPRAHRAGRVKAKAARSAVARSASLDAA